MIRSGREADGCFMGNQSLCFRKVIWAQEGMPRSQHGSPTTLADWTGLKTFKIILKMSRYLGSRGNAQITTWLLDDISRLNWPKNFQNHSQNVTFRSVRGPDKCYIGSQPLCFHWMNLSKFLGLNRGFLHHKVAPQPQKWPELAKKRPKPSQKCHVPLCQGIRHLLHWQPTSLFLWNDSH